MTKGSGKRSISIGRDAREAVIVTGDHNAVTGTLKKVSLPPLHGVDIQAELAALRAALARLAAPDARRIEDAIDYVEDELKKPAPDKDKIGKALERAVGYAQKAEEFAAATEKLIPHVINVAAWLGGAGRALLRTFGLTI